MASIQFNLLPDVKLEYIKAQYRKRMIVSVSVIVSGVALAIFVLLFLFVRINQPRYMSNLDKDINTNVKTLQAKPDLDKIVTLQSQLASLPVLHDKKPFTSRLFEYITQLTPKDTSISKVEADVQAGTIVIGGEAKDIGTVNKFIDTLKYTEYSVQDDDSKKGNAFNQVVLKTFSVAVTSTNTNGGATASYEISLNFDPVIFENTARDGNAVTNAVKLNVPKITTSGTTPQNAGTPTQQGNAQ